MEEAYQPAVREMIFMAKAYKAALLSFGNISTKEISMYKEDVGLSVQGWGRDGRWWADLLQIAKNSEDYQSFLEELNGTVLEEVTHAKADYRHKEEGAGSELFNKLTRLTKKELSKGEKLEEFLKDE